MAFAVYARGAVLHAVLEKHLFVKDPVRHLNVKHRVRQHLVKLFVKQLNVKHLNVKHPVWKSQRAGHGQTIATSTSRPSLRIGFLRLVPIRVLMVSDTGSPLCLAKMDLLWVFSYPGGSA